MLTLNDFRTHTGEIVARLQTLVQYESPTGDKAAVDRLGLWLVEQLKRLGAGLTIDPQDTVGNPLIARWPGQASAEGEGILLLAHMDTVHPLGTLARNPCALADGRLHGPGVQDMKAGIAIALTALESLLEHGQLLARPVTLLITTDEETGSAASRPLIEELAGQSALVLCLEPALENGALKTWRKGVGDISLHVYGRAAHAGAAHAEGRNAIEEMAHQILAIQKLTDYERGTTLNVGVVRGGTAANVVPDEAIAEVDLRVMQAEEVQRVMGQLQALRPALEGTRLEVSGGLNRPPMPRDATMIATFQRAQAIGRRLGLELAEGGTGGGSDANFVAPLGVPVLDGLGAVGAGQHSEREYVLVDSLPERAALLAALLTEW